MNLLLKIGFAIKKIRIEKNISVTEFSNLLFGENTRGRLYNIENGKRGLTIQTLEKILETLNYDFVLVPKDKM